MPLNPKTCPPPDRPPRPKKSLGQNFLKDRGLAGRIVAALEIADTDYVLEIGPGAGALTELIYGGNPRPAGLALLEKDRHWVAVQAKALAGSGINGLAVHSDALDFAWEKLDAAAAAGKSWKVIGNLPYNVASPLLWELACRSRAFGAAVVMVQREVAQRITAEPGGKAYGALSVWLQSFLRPRKVMDVPPTAFYPAPKVWSQVLHLQPRPDRYSGDPADLAKLLKICFQKRRKQLGTILRPYLAEHLCNWFKSQGLSLTLRPEQLTPEQFQALAVELFAAKLGLTSRGESD